MKQNSRNKRVRFYCLDVRDWCFGYLFFVVIPVTLYAEADCLKKGYPEARVTIGLERYCLNLDGLVTGTAYKQ